MSDFTVEEGKDFVSPILSPKVAHSNLVDFRMENETNKIRYNIAWPILQGRKGGEPARRRA